MISKYYPTDYSIITKRERHQYMERQPDITLNTWLNLISARMELILHDFWCDCTRIYKTSSTPFLAKNLRPESSHETTDKSRLWNILSDKPEFLKNINVIKDKQYRDTVLD